MLSNHAASPWLCRDLLRLNVGRNHLSEFPRDAISTLKNLNQLDLSENKIGLLKPGDFQGEWVLLP